MESFPNAQVIALKIKRIRFLKSEKVFQKENSAEFYWRKVALVENFLEIVCNYCFSILKMCFLRQLFKMVKYRRKKSCRLTLESQAAAYGILFSLCCLQCRFYFVQFAAELLVCVEQI